MIENKTNKTKQNKTLMEKKHLSNKNWVLIQHSSKYYIGIILSVDSFFINIIGYRDEKKSFKTKEIKIISYKPNINIIPINDIIKRNPEVDRKKTELIEEIKKQENYDLLLTNTMRFTKQKDVLKTNKIQKTTLWKKFYSWVGEPTQKAKVSPVLFFSRQGLEFFLVVTKLGKFKFLDKNFEEIQSFSDKNLNKLLKKTKTNNEKKIKETFGLNSIFDNIEIDENFLEKL